MSAGLFSQSWPIVTFGEVDSTNEEARRRAAAGDVNPTWLVAEAQSSGRGRRGRDWSSPVGNLYATALFHCDISPVRASLLCFSAGLAILDAAESLGAEGGALTLKWPNDVQAGEAKLAGVLIETGRPVVGSGLWLAAGFGVNLAHAPVRDDRLTARLADVPGVREFSAAAFVLALDSAFRARLRSLLDEGFEPTRRDWLEHAHAMGARVSVAPSTGPVAGVMTGMAPDGALVLQLDDGREHLVHAGEVALVGRAQG